jgi:hypothetical protein
VRQTKIAKHHPSARNIVNQDGPAGDDVYFFQSSTLDTRSCVNNCTTRAKRNLTSQSRRGLGQETSTSYTFRQSRFRRETAVRRVMALRNENDSFFREQSSVAFASAESKSLIVVSLSVTLPRGCSSLNDLLMLAL